MKKDCVIIFCAHNDDQIIGAGGTIAKYVKERREVLTYIFSYGESSHPHLKKEVTARFRIDESKKANKILGGGSLCYMGLKEGRFEKEIEGKNLDRRIREIIQKKKPSKIFTHSLNDPHPDHKAVNRVIMKVVKEMGYEGEVYSFDIWNIVTLRRKPTPQLVVDITDTFGQKIEAFQCHKSQKLAMLSLLWDVYLKAIINGLHHHFRYAEVFNRIR